MSDSPQEVDAQLRAKVTSKMTVATFLAGFTFAALLQLLNNSANLSSASIKVAVVSLTLALALFIAAVYMYDRLSMPRDKWDYHDPVKPPDPVDINPAMELIEKLHFKVYDINDMRNQGARYYYMIYVWQLVFTPAVICALVGFCAILYSTHNDLIFWVGVGVIVVVMIYYIILRPILGKVD